MRQLCGGAYGQAAAHAAPHACSTTTTIQDYTACEHQNASAHPGARLGAVGVGRRERHQVPGQQRAVLAAAQRAQRARQPRVARAQVAPARAGGRRCLILAKCKRATRFSRLSLTS